MKRTLLIILFVVLTQPSPAQNGAAVKRSWAPTNYDSLYKGQVYKPFQVTTLGGKTVSNGSCEGKVTFMTFWFEGCAGCRGEFSELNLLYKRLKSDTNCVFIAITFDEQDSLPGFVKKYNLDYPIATTGDEAVFKEMNHGMGCPGIVILDKDEKIALIGMKAITQTKWGGFDITENEVMSLVKSLE